MTEDVDPYEAGLLHLPAIKDGAARRIDDVRSAFSDKLLSVKENKKANTEGQRVFEIIYKTEHVLATLLVYENGAVVGTLHESKDQRGEGDEPTPLSEPLEFVQAKLAASAAVRTLFNIK